MNCRTFAVSKHVPCILVWDRSYPLRICSWSHRDDSILGHSACKGTELGVLIALVEAALDSMTGAVGKGMLIDGVDKRVSSAAVPWVSKADAVGIVVVGNMEGAVWGTVTNCRHKKK
jgi:hypothetical protein